MFGRELELNEPRDCGRDSETGSEASPRDILVDGKLGQEEEKAKRRKVGEVGGKAREKQSIPLVEHVYISLSALGSSSVSLER